jgi:hypothetical protein
MAANVYARLRTLKERLHISHGNDDEQLFLLLSRVSRELESRTCSFAAITRTQYYDGNGKARLLLWRPLISVTSLKLDLDGRGTYGYTLTANTDYWLERAEGRDAGPYTRIRLNPNSIIATVWPCFQPRLIEIAGVWGYSNDSAPTGQTVGNTTQIAADGTTLTVADASGISLGETLVIESEQVYVAAWNSKTSLTIERGVNGTVAMAHANGVAIARRVYPVDIEEAVLERARTLWTDTIGSGSSDDMRFAAQVPSGGYARWIGVLDDYRLPGVA